MAQDKQISAQGNDSLKDMLAKDLESLTESELLAECEKDYGSVENMIDVFKGIVEHAFETSSRQNLNNIFSLSAEEKRDLIERVKRTYPGELTMAARNADGSGDDIDRQLEDLIDLGVIDRDGNIL